MNVPSEIDLTGLRCPMPIVQLTKLFKQVEPGADVRALASDPAFLLDVEAWCRRTGHLLVANEQRGATQVAVIRKRGDA